MAKNGVKNVAKNVAKNGVSRQYRWQQKKLWGGGCPQCGRDVKEVAEEVEAGGGLCVKVGSWMKRGFCVRCYAKHLAQTRGAYYLRRGDPDWMLRGLGLEPRGGGREVDWEVERRAVLARDTGRP